MPAIPGVQMLAAGEVYIFAARYLDIVEDSLGAYLLTELTK